MAGSLIKVSEDTVTSSQASVTLSGINSTYEVYVVTIEGCVPVSDSVFLTMRVTESGTPNTTSNYVISGQLLRSNAAYNNTSATNESSLFLLGQNTGTGANEEVHLVNYIFGAASSSDFTYVTTENVFLDNSGVMNGLQGGGVFTSASAVDGVQYFFSSGNIASGTFRLYGLKK